MKISRSLFLLFACLCVAPVGCSYVQGTYTDLPQGTAINLTADGPADWVKWGNGGSGALVWSTVRKSGVTPIISTALAPVGTPPQGTNVVLAAFTPANPANNLLNFSWTDGNAPVSGSSGTGVTETILPAQFSYPLGLGATFTVQASQQKRVLDVYVQGFNADMLMTATLSGGKTHSIVISPTKNPTGDVPNDYSFGRYRIEFMGEGQVLTVTVKTQAPLTNGAQSAFPNAGFFAAALREPTPAFKIPDAIAMPLQQAVAFLVKSGAI